MNFGSKSWHDGILANTSNIVSGIQPDGLRPPPPCDAELFEAFYGRRYIIICAKSNLDEVLQDCPNVGAVISPIVQQTSTEEADS